MNCRFSDAAATELEQAFDYYNRRSGNLGQKFLDEIMRGVHHIAETPFKWPEMQADIRKYRIARFNYGLIYRVVSECAEIIAVMHPSRGPGYWKKRVK